MGVSAVVFVGWPELPVPAHVPETALSELADHGRVVWAEGNPEAELMVILDNPGAREDAHGVPFVCGTRRTLWEALEQAGIDPASVLVTYLLKRRPRRAYHRPSAWERYRPLLQAQVETHSPSALVLAGNTVVRALLDPDAGVKDLRGQATSWCGVPAVVTYHPLAVRRRPNLHPGFVEDLRFAKGLLVKR